MKSPRPVLHLISQAHLDPVWLWPERDGAAEVLTTMQSAVDRAKETPSFRFTRSSASAYRWVQEMDPRLHAEIQGLVRAGRWEVIGGWVEQPDCNLPSAESFLRQGLYGKAYFRREFGARGNTTIGYNPDSFGHAGGLPRILQHSGFDAYVFMRPEPWSNPDVPLLFWWESDRDADSRVLGCRIPIQYSQSYAATADDVENVVRESAVKGFAPGFDHGVMWFGVGNHGGGPTREHIARILALQKDSTLPEIRFSTVKAFLQAVRKSPALADLPVISGELGYVFRGCYSATGEVKRQHRACEKALQTAETLDVLANGGDASPETLREAWWRFLFNEFHDILAGTCVASTQEATRNRFGSVLTEAGEHSLRCALSMARRVDTRGEKGSVLFVANPLPWPRTALVQLDTFVQPHGRATITHLETRSGRRVPIQWLPADANFGPWGLRWGKLTAAVELPAGGYRVFRVCSETLKTAPPDPASAADASNPQFQKRAEAESPTFPITKNPALDHLNIPPLGNILASAIGTIVVRDTSSTWGHGVSAYDEILGRPEITGTQILVEGPLVSITRQKSRWDKSEIWMDVIRTAHSPIVELRLRINWQQQRQMLKLEIPTRLKSTVSFAKMPAEVAQRPADGTEYPCHDWVALQGTLKGQPAILSLLNDSSYSFDAERGCLRMVLVRGVPHAEHPPFEYQSDDNIAFLDQGWQEWRFGILAGPGTWRDFSLERHSQELQIPAEAMLDNAHPGTAPWELCRISIEPANVALLALKPAESEKGTVLRIQETCGKQTTTRIRIGDERLRIALQPWEITTLHLNTSPRGVRAEHRTALE